MESPYLKYNKEEHILRTKKQRTKNWVLTKI